MISNLRHLYMFLYPIWMSPLEKHLFSFSNAFQGFPGGTSGKEPTCQCRRHKRHGFDPWVGFNPWRRAQQTTPGFFFSLFIYWRIIALQNFVFCQTSTWINHSFMHISPPFWTSLLSPSPFHPSSLIQSPCLSFLSHTANSYWLFILQMVM